MTDTTQDDLVKRLKNPRPMSMFLTRADQASDWTELLKVAADRIEELEAKLKWALEERDATFALMLKRAETAETKLANAVKALRGWIEFANAEGMPVLLSDLEAAELTGGKNA